MNQQHFLLVVLGIMVIVFDIVLNKLLNRKFIRLNEQKSDERADYKNTK
jgi:hypothetical protein